MVVFSFYMMCIFLSVFDQIAQGSEFVNSLKDKKEINFTNKSFVNYKKMLDPLSSTIMKKSRYKKLPRGVFLMCFIGLMVNSAAYSMAYQNDIHHKDSYSSSSIARQPNIAIIGAGLSGLTMGYRLKQKGYEDVSVYEAKPRVGGRVHTVYVKNYDGTYSIAELGGQSITDGGDAKHLLGLAKELGLEIEDDPRCLSRGFYTGGTLYDSKELLRTSGFTQDTLAQILEKLPFSVHSMKDIIDHVFAGNSLLKRVFSYHVGSYEGLPTEDLAIIHNIDTLKYFLPGGKATFQEATGIDEPFLFKYIKGGNSKLPLALFEALEDRVFVNKALRKVSRYEGRIKLDFTDNTISFCDKLILSTPCSTFKDIVWEDALLPQERLDEINKVQYASNGKVVMPLDYSNSLPVFSSVNTDHIGTLQNNDYKLLVFFSDGIWGKSLGENFNNYSSSVVEMVEANYGSQRSLRIDPVAVSEEVYKKYDTPIIKSWADDPYAQGSYSAIGNMLGGRFLEQTSVRDVPVKMMFSPISDQIFFIGEHTSLIEEMGSMEAAVESAERITRLF